MFEYLIVGAGYSGCILAERIASQLGRKVLIVDRRNHIAGNAYDEHDENGVLVHRYGPHIFHTNSKKVWDYLSMFTEWRPYFHHVLGVVDGKKVPVPFNLNSLYALFPPRYAAKLEDLLLAEYGFGKKVPILQMKGASPDLRFLADFVYRNVFHSYTVKQWNLTPEQLDASVTGRVPVYISRDDRYFQDTYQAMPVHGYTEMFRRMTNHPNIKILLNTDYREVLDGIRFKRMIYTGPIDSYFDQMHGQLPYRSLRFDFKTVDQEWHQEVGTVNYPNEYDFTRITEQKYLSGQKLPKKSTIIVEYPQAYEWGKNEAYYPIPRDENRELYEKYAAEVTKLNGSVLFVGRLADYKYYNMDQAAARALKVFEDEIA
ncbi:MAG TPA: UDP-galactopyranose mutase [Thermoanaerobaculia bacterium]|jgi:UDP-galactopyranose mutase